MTLDAQARLDGLMDKLRGQGYRLTPQRRAVLRVLLTSSDHPSAEQVYNRLQAEFPGISLGTIYKTAALLKEQGELLEIGFCDAGNRLDALRPYPHPHLICVRCKSVVDLVADAVQATAEEVARSTGYRIVSQRLDFFGVCPRCQEPRGTQGSD
jgi:Fur family transcriptional regulator, peroxide stress response regulator